MDEYDPDLHTYENHKKVFEYCMIVPTKLSLGHKLTQSYRVTFDASRQVFRSRPTQSPARRQRKGEIRPDDGAGNESDNARAHAQHQRGRKLDLGLLYRSSRPDAVVCEQGTSYVEKLHEENRTKRGLPNRPPTESEAKAIFLSYKGLFADSLHKVANNCGKLWMRDSNATSQSLAHRLSGAAGSQFLPVARY